MRSTLVTIISTILFVSLSSAQTSIDTLEIDTIGFDTVAVDTIKINPVKAEILVIDTIEIKGIAYTVCQKFPEEICGEYLYNKKEGPKVLLNPNGSGYFEGHGIKPLPMNFWIVCNEKGVPKRTYGLDLNYSLTILIQYDDAKVRELKGEYEMLDVRIAYDEGYAIIHQERFHLFRR